MFSLSNIDGTFFDFPLILVGISKDISALVDPLATAAFRANRRVARARGAGA